MKVLRIDSSANTETSVTRDLTDKIIASLDAETVVTRDLARSPLPQITHTWAVARAVPADERTDEQRAALAQSDALIDEIRAADTLVIGLPVYNFSVPASLKAWIDLVARAGETFRYTEAGPEGLLKGKRAILAVASGGTPVGSDFDYATTYMRHVLGFIGITDVSIVAADKLALDPEATMKEAHRQIDELKLAA
ncbi:FMN-dependent NADH-azoreductase [Marimonas sp. MJW-29]|uniref:FMN dependent NADH:quinone oxidoreductase n=1 Tax=Sulfitobacter sediminis TaxID=3234186 RepID=A0ABV3RJ06_9RHOB